MTTQTLQETFDQALRQHHAGRVQEAEALYRQVLCQQPDHADALHALGIARLHLGSAAESIELIQKAVAIAPRQPHYLANLGSILSQQGRTRESIAAYREALALKGDSAEWHNGLGNALVASGQVEEAIDVYRRAVTLRPDFPEALNNLATAYNAVRRHDEAASCYRQSIALRPTPEVYCNLGSALLTNGQPEPAAEAYRQALALRPDYVEAHYNLGVACGAMSRFDESIDALRKAIALRPNYPEALNNLGNALCEKNRHAEAVDAYRQALALQPTFGEAQNNLGIALHKLGKLDEAIACYHESLRLRPGRAEIYYHLSNVLKEKGEIEQAMIEVRKAISLRSDYAEAYVTLAALLVDQNHWDEGIAVSRQAIAARPNWPGGYNHLGFLLRGRGQYADAIAMFRHALSLDPRFRESLVNLGTTLHEMGKLDEAIDAYRHALEQYPDSVEANLNIGNSLKDSGQLDEAIVAYRKAAALTDDPTKTHNLLFALNYAPDVTAEEVIQEHLRWGEACTAATGEQFHVHDNDRDSERRIRIGYVSPDFRRHVVGYNMLPLLERHDHTRFEIFCYSNVPCPDDLTDRFRAVADSWRDIKAMNDKQVAQSVRADRIDILVDLALHTANTRLPVFARKPAPIQVTFAGYPGTTGLRQIDYRLTDPYLDPPEQTDRYYAERSYRLADSFWCYKPYAGSPPVGPLPATVNGFVTFGCLNNFCKINQPVLELWARILRELPSSRLLLMSRPGVHRRKTLQFLQTQRVDPQRVEFLDYQTADVYLRTYQRIDLGLDTFPYNGHTTTLDSLWMGVPVVTLVGKTAVARAGWCQLSNLALTELAAQTPDQFVQIASAWAADLPRLAQLRAGLRQRMENSPLTDWTRFTRNIETAYRDMWRTWCNAES